MIRLLSLLFLTCSLSISLFAQKSSVRSGIADYSSHVYSDNIRLKQYSVEEGLEASYVYDIAQDSLNRLWLATNLGLIIYDNNSFYFPKEKELRLGEITALIYSKGSLYMIADQKKIKTYNGTTTKTLSIEGNTPRTINCLLSKKNGDILAGTSNGIYKLDKEKGSFSALKSPADSAFVFALTENSKGIVAAGTGTGLYVLNGEKAGKINHPVLSNAKVMSVLYDKNNYLWAGTVGQGMYAVMGTLVRSFTTNDGLSHSTVISLEQDKNGNITAGTYFGYNHLKAPLYKPRAYLPGADINASSIWKIKKDRQNNLWIGTENGIFTYSPSPFTDITDKNGIVNSFVISAENDKKGNIWFGTQYGISRLSGDTFHNYHILFNDKALKYFSIGTGNDGKQYFGTYGLVVLEGKKFRFFDSQDGFTDYPVNAILKGDSGMYLGTKGGGLFFMKDETFTKLPAPGTNIRDIIRDKFGRLVIATEKGIFFNTGSEFRKVDGSEMQEVNVLFQARSGEILAGTNKGVLIIQPEKMSLKAYLAAMENEQVLDFEDDDKHIWAGTSRRIWQIDPKAPSVEYIGLKHGYKGGGVIGRSLVKDDNGNIYFGSLRHLSKYNPRSIHRKAGDLSLFIQSVQLFNEDIKWHLTHPDSLPWEGISYTGAKSWLDIPENLKLPHNVNQVTVRFNALSLQEGNAPEIRYQLKGFEGGWAEAPESREITYLNLPPGNYTLRLEARLPGEEWSASTEYNFSIVPAFWQTNIFGGGIALMGLAGLILGVKLRTRSLTNKKKLLESMIRNRTFELYEQKVEMEKKSVMLEEKNEEIFKSIRYAKRIQEAIIPPERIFAASFSDAFVLYQPKDIVSGDFYWIEKIAPNDLLFAVADCTGHGVPGAFMSIVGYNALNKAVNEEHLVSPGRILNSLSNTVANTIRHSAEETAVRDGMDISICRLKNFLPLEDGPIQPELEFAGANNPLWIIRDADKPAPLADEPDKIRLRGESRGKILYELRATKQSIGGAEYIHFNPFSSQAVKLFQGDSIYLFTDGFADTFGGPENRKFKKKNLAQLLLNSEHLSMPEQKEVLLNSFTQWKGDYEQIDDVCMAGVKI